MLREIFWAVSHNERQIVGHWERYRGSETAKFAQWDYADVDADSWRRQITQLSFATVKLHDSPVYFSLIFYYVPAIGKIPICPKTCCGPRHCQHVSESIRRALIFGALWQHHGLHDYFFVQHHDQQGTMRIPCNASEVTQCRRHWYLDQILKDLYRSTFNHLSNLKKSKKIRKSSE